VTLRVATLTANPALDVCASVDRVEPQRKLRCDSPRLDAGGGGLNAARVIRRLGGRAVAVFTAGGRTGERLRDLVSAEAFPTRIVPIAGETREDFTATERVSGDQYRFVMPGPRLMRAEADLLARTLAELAPRPDIVLASGSLPPGAPAAFYGRIARQVRDAGGKFAVDASGRALRNALAEGVWLAKPNLRELEELSGTPLPTVPLQAAACKVLVDRGDAEVVALTLGRDGALLCSAAGTWRAPGLNVTAISSVGAGDSFAGAFVWSIAGGASLPEALKWAMAAGAAALLAPGTQLCRAADVRRLALQVCVQPL
jgi:6-phosphofructokinase 2